MAENKNSVELKVPYTSEIPTNSWLAPWNNACEEASLVMVKGYYFGYENISKKIAAADMLPLFKIENKIFGGNANTNAIQTAKLINEYTDITATIKKNPTLEEIKNELTQGRPVIAMLYAKNLPNPNHRWRAGGSYYHVLVLIGFDESTKEFITHDSGDAVTGSGYRYTYDVIMDNLHDYNQKTHHTDGVATVLFTDSKILFKVKNDPKVYLIRHDTKYHITSSEVFKKHGWQWKKIKIVEQKKLDNLKTGDPISS